MSADDENVVVFDRPFEAVSVRLVPLAWVSQICMRIVLFGYYLTGKKRSTKNPILKPFGIEYFIRQQRQPERSIGKICMSSLTVCLTNLNEVPTIV